MKTLQYLPSGTNTTEEISEDCFCKPLSFHRFLELQAGYQDTVQLQFVDCFFFFVIAQPNDYYFQTRLVTSIAKTSYLLTQMHN